MAVTVRLGLRCSPMASCNASEPFRNRERAFERMFGEQAPERRSLDMLAGGISRRWLEARAALYVGSLSKPLVGQLLRSWLLRNRAPHAWGPKVQRHTTGPGTQCGCFRDRVDGVNQDGRSVRAAGVTSEITCVDGGFSHAIGGATEAG